MPAITPPVYPDALLFLALRAVGAEDDALCAPLSSALDEASQKVALTNSGLAVDLRLRATSDGQTLASFSVSTNVVHALRDLRRSELEELVSDALMGDRTEATIEMAVRAQLDWYENSYSCDRDDTKWTDNWSCACNDECPCCGAETEPHHSVQLMGLDEDAPAGYHESMPEKVNDKEMIAVAPELVTRPRA